MKSLERLSHSSFHRQVMALPVIPDELTPILAIFGEGWRIGEPWSGGTTETVSVVFTEPPPFAVEVKKAEHRI